jgi:DNA-binding response OmpR family regulator
MKKTRILLAEDDEQLGYVIKDSLEEAGYEVVLCSDGQMAIEEFDKKNIDLCLLDIMMPNKDGFMVARKIRSISDVVPILFITSKSLEDDKVKGFESGADDFITKPFSIRELLLRIDVFLRRTQKIAADHTFTFQLGDILFSPAELTLKKNDETVDLTQRESDLLEFLCNHPNKVIKREEVLLHVWGKSDYFLGRSMDVFMAKLRKHLKNTAGVTIETIHGIGFRFNITN